MQDLHMEIIKGENKTVVVRLMQGHRIEDFTVIYTDNFMVMQTNIVERVKTYLCAMFIK